MRAGVGDGRPLDRSTAIVRASPSMSGLRPPDPQPLARLADDFLPAVAQQLNQPGPAGHVLLAGLEILGRVLGHALAVVQPVVPASLCKKIGLRGQDAVFGSSAPTQNVRLNGNTLEAINGLNVQFATA